MSIIAGKLINAKNLNEAFVSTNVDQTIDGYKKFKKDIYSTKINTYTDDAFGTLCSSSYYSSGGPSYRTDLGTNMYFDLKPGNGTLGLVLRSNSNDDNYVGINSSGDLGALYYNNSTNGITFDVSGNTIISGTLSSKSLNVTGSIIASTNINASGNLTVVNGTFAGDVLSKGVGMGASGNEIWANAYSSLCIGYRGMGGVITAFQTTYIGDGKMNAIASFVGGTTNAVSIIGTLSSNNFIRGTQLISTVAIGTSPLVVASTTLVSNLNVDMVDNIHGSQFMRNDIVSTTNSQINIVTSSGGGLLKIRQVGTTYSDGGNAAIITDTDNSSGASNYSFEGRAAGIRNFSVRADGLVTMTAGNVGANRILTTGDEGSGKGIDSDTIDGLQGTDLLLSNIASEQIASFSNVKVQSTSSSERFEVEFNEASQSLDFCYYGS